MYFIQIIRSIFFATCLQTAISLIAILTFGVSVFLLPRLAQQSAELYREEFSGGEAILCPASAVNSRCNLIPVSTINLINSSLIIIFIASLIIYLVYVTKNIIQKRWQRFLQKEKVDNREEDLAVLNHPQSLDQRVRLFLIPTKSKILWMIAFMLIGTAITLPMSLFAGLGEIEGLYEKILFVSPVFAFLEIVFGGGRSIVDFSPAFAIGFFLYYFVSCSAEVITDSSTSTRSWLRILKILGISLFFATFLILVFILLAAPYFRFK
ncbi:hypothetical protein HY439_00285 [Candidatus Microgenomates bacterium]|nr:hypothetical protein [Candidatus Microgenomates bacterium]